MPVPETTLRPGLLVSLKTSISGNVKYDRIDIEPDHRTETGEKLARWETKRVINDPDEHEKAVIVRGKCRSLITSVCSTSAFGLLCPDTRTEDLDKAIRAANILADAFNQQASLTKIGVFVITGRVAADDVQAVRAINSEVRDLLDTMENGIQNLDVEAVRNAATKAKQIGQMLTPSAAKKIEATIENVRSLARRMVKAGEQAAQEIDEATLRQLRESRTAFLDLDWSSEPDKEVKIEAPEVTARALDLTPEAEEPPAAPRPRRKLSELELDTEEPTAQAAAPVATRELEL